MSTELAWVAGLLEGEGCFRIKPGSREGFRASLVVNVSSTDRDVIYRCAALFPAHGKIQTRTFTNPNCKTAYVVEWYGQAAEDVMRAVRPFMCQRRAAKIDECLSATNLSHHPGRIWPNNPRINGKFVSPNKGDM